MATPNMALIIPTVSVTLGPTYATQVNTAFDLVDSHDHTPGKGPRVPSAGILINTDLTFGGYSAVQLLTTAYQSQSASLSSGTTNAVYSVLGDLYWNNGGGTAVKITNGGALNTSLLVTTVLAPYATSTDYTILPADIYGYIQVNTGPGPRTITLPSAAAVSNGRYYVIADVSGNALANNITIARAGADTIDGATSATIAANYGSVMLVCDGSSKWKTVVRIASQTLPGQIVLAGDLAGVGSGPTVQKINGSVVPSGGSLTTGNVLQVLTPSGLQYGPVNLAGGANYVTGVLPSANMFQATTGTSGAVLLGTDLGGSAAAPWVVQLSGPGGSGGLVPIKAASVRFDASVSGPIFGHTDRTTAGSGSNLLIYGQSANSNGTGGDVRVTPGINVGGGANNDGAFRVINGNTLATDFFAGCATGSNSIRVVSVGGACATSNLPSASYSGSLFLFNGPASDLAAIADPVGGAAIFASGGAVYVRSLGGGGGSATSVELGGDTTGAAPTIGASNTLPLATQFSGLYLRFKVDGVYYKFPLFRD